jgi:hypothetical protein
MRAWPSDPFAVVVAAGIVAVEAIFSPQPNHLMGYNRGSAVIEG